MSELLPPDGVPWPPEPPVQASARNPPLDELLRPVPQVGDTAREIPDWRTMRNDLAPPGYVANEAAVASSAARWSWWCTVAAAVGAAAAVAAVVGADEVLVAVLSVLAVMFGLAGWRVVRVGAGIARGRVFAAVGVALGVLAVMSTVLPSLLGE